MPGRAHVTEATNTGPGLREAVALWAAWAVVTAMVFVTYARLPAADFYNVSGTGVRAGAGRALVLVNWPVAVAAIALAAVAADRMLAARPSLRQRRAVVSVAAAAAILCAVVAVPGVVTQSDLDAKPANVPAAAGVALAVAVTLAALRRTGVGASARRRGDGAALALLAVMGVAALPWIFANAGVYVGSVPGLEHVFMSRQILPEPGHPHLRAVHLGNHEGLDGWLLAATALGLRRVLPRMRPTPLRPVLGCYLAVMLAYGVLVAFGDGWNEQVVKRGWATWQPPGVLTPTIGTGWAILLAAAVVLYLAAFRVTSRPSPAAAPAT
jgi:hypothetical protein